MGQELEKLGEPSDHNVSLTPAKKERVDRLGGIALESFTVSGGVRRALRVCPGVKVILSQEHSALLSLPCSVTVKQPKEWPWI